MDSFSAQLPYKDEESGLNKAKDQVNELIRKQVLARITVHKIGFLPFSILLWQILWAILVSSIGKHEIILAGIIENKS